MNLEQIVKETVAKIVAEKHLTPAEAKKKEEIVKAMKGTFKGPAPAMYAIATKKAEKLAEETPKTMQGGFNSVNAQDKKHKELMNIANSLFPKFGGKLTNFKSLSKDQIDQVYSKYASSNKLEEAPKTMQGGFDSVNAQDKKHKALMSIANELFPEFGGKLTNFKSLSKDQMDKVYSKYSLSEDDLNEDYEVAMAQDSLDSIIRAAMMLKSELGNQEVNLPAWIQDHITNSENYINQAAKGYHESDAQIDDEAGTEEMNEEYDFVRSAIESASGDKISHTEEDDYGRTIYWSTKNPNVNYFVGMGGEFEGNIYLYNGETGERYPIGDLKHYGDGQNHAADDDMHEAFKPKSTFDDYTIGNTAMLGGKKVKITAMEMDDETGERRARVRFEDGTIKKINMNSLDETRDPNSKSDTPYYAVFDVHSKQPHYIIAKSASEMLSRLNGYIKAKAETNPEYNFSYDMESLQDDYYNGKLMPHVISDDFASVTKNAEEFKQDLSYYPNAIEYKGSQELDEATVRRWQHYAGIK